MSHTSSSDTYEVEKVIGKKVVGGVVSYRIKWVGYPSYANTWEPMENLEEALDAIRQFEEKDNRRDHKKATSVADKGRQSAPKKAVIEKAPIKRAAKIVLKSTSEPQIHWVYGHRLKKIIGREGSDYCHVMWDDSTQSVEHIAKISWYEPQLLNEFLKKEMARTEKEDTRFKKAEIAKVKGEPHH